MFKIGCLFKKKKNPLHRVYLKKIIGFYYCNRDIVNLR